MIFSMRWRIEKVLRGRSVWAALLVGLVAFPGTGFAQELPDSLVGGRYTESELRLPHLGRHVFAPNGLVPDPFITTFVRNSLGMGKANDVETPLIVIDGQEILGLRGDLLYAVLNFEYQQRIKSWIAARGQIRVIGRLGTDVQAILSDGITTVSGFEFGWLIKIHKTDRIMLSGDLVLANQTFTLLNVLGMVQDIVEGIPPKLTRTTPALRAGGGLRFGWSVSELFGVTAVGNLGYGEAVIRTEKDNMYFNMGATLDFDLDAKTPVPVGLALGYRFDRFPEGGEAVSSTVNAAVFRISYNGRPDFGLGLEFSTERIESKRFREPFNTGAATIDFRYYF
jgi:hypothetical protein